VQADFSAPIHALLQEFAMSTAACCAPVVIDTRPSSRLRLQALLREAVAALKRSLTGRGQAGMRDPLAAEAVQRLQADGLSPAVLHDIGFASWQVDEAQRRFLRDVERWL
jgi:hypothetical protein